MAMNRLLIAATHHEIAPFLHSIAGNDLTKRGITKIGQLIGFSPEIPDVSMLITGIGIHSTVFHLTQCLLTNNFHDVIQVGIAGSFHHRIKKGELVEVISDRFADLAVDDRGELVPLTGSGMTDDNQFPFREGWLPSDLLVGSGLLPVKGITVNTVSGSRARIDQLVELFDPDIETMEGAAALFVGRMLKIPVSQIRAISNYVEPRGNSEWQKELAIGNLNRWLHEVITRV